MTEAKHTEGPWEARIQRSKDGRDLGWIIEHQKGRIGWASLAYADSNRESDYRDPAREANARLIAAAPDMLAVLKDALEMAKLAETLTGCRGDDDFVAGFKAKVEAALSKAGLPQ